MIGSWLPAAVYIYSHLYTLTFVMETQPLKLDEYCRQYGISFFDVQLRCVFCRHLVSTSELADFHCKHLSLIWKEKVCYAACCACLRLCARCEAERYYQCNVCSSLIEDIVRKPLCDIVIRCLYCLAKLDLLEKLEHKYLRKRFHLVRGYWRGDCRNCKQK